MEDTLQKLEAVLFASGSRMTKKQLAKQVKCSNEELEQILGRLRQERANSGVVVVDDGTQVALATNPALRGVIEELQKEEESAPLSRAVQETLSIIAYAGPITKVDLDFLRGVNTQHTLRRLLMRGLIQDMPGTRKRLLAISVEFLLHLGIQQVEELPEYANIRQTMLDGVQKIKKRTEQEEI